MTYMTPVATRMTAEERRADVLRAAVAEFARTGFQGTSTEPARNLRRGRMVALVVCVALVVLGGGGFAAWYLGALP